MHNATIKDLQELGAFVLASGCRPKEMKKVAEMIRQSRDYRWVGIYKVTQKEFVILAGTGNEPPAYPRVGVEEGD
jgi:putative methionine-R-sulfoxide reductase with GAF domain